jgi:hypothetical protein
LTKCELTEHVATHVPHYTGPSPQLGKLAGENVGGASQFQGTVAYELLDLVKFRAHIAFYHQIDAHVRNGDYIERSIGQIVGLQSHKAVCCRHVGNLNRFTKAPTVNHPKPLISAQVSGGLTIHSPLNVEVSNIL